MKIGEVLVEGGIYEPCSDISTNWWDVRSGFGYKLLYAMPINNLNIPKGKRKYGCSQI